MTIDLSTIAAWKRAGILLTEDDAGRWRWSTFPEGHEAALSPPFPSLKDCLADVEARFGTLD